MSGAFLTGWIGALVQRATRVIVIQITVNTSAPPGSEEAAQCPKNIPGRCREQEKGGAAVTGTHAEQADGEEHKHKADLTWVNSEVCWRLPAGLILNQKKKKEM